MSIFRQCPVCTHRCELPKLLDKATVGVEVGVLHGNYSAALLSQWPGFLHLIDPWEDYPEYKDKPQDHRHNFNVAMDKIAPYMERVKVWRLKNSEQLAAEIGRVDFAYIDGNHAFRYIVDDLRIWWKQIRPGGILAGHDLFQMEHPAVTEAIVLFATQSRRHVYMIPGFEPCPCGEGGAPSWYIVK